MTAPVCSGSSVTPGWSRRSGARSRIKKWLRDWKLALIEDANPDWLDLAADWYPQNDPAWVSPEEPD